MKKILLTLTLVVAMLLFTINIFAASSQFPQIINVTLTSADTEYSQALTGVKKFTIQCRTNYAVRLAFESGYVATPTNPYFTIKAGAIYWEDDIASDKTLYFASSQAGVVVEILVWR